MGKIGSLSYPDLTLNEAIELIRKIDAVGGKVSPTGLARLIGIDPRGAGLHSRIEDLKTYGFIDSESNGELKLTDTAQELLGGKTSKAWDAVWAIPLYAEMHRRLQGREPTDKVVLNNVLYNITKADQNEIARRANRLKNNYMEALPYLTGDKKPEATKMESNPIHTPSRLSLGTTPVPEGSDFYLVDKRKGMFILTIDDKSKLGIAQRYLEDQEDSLEGGSLRKGDKRPSSKRTATEETVTA